MASIVDIYRSHLAAMIQNTSQNQEVTEKNVFQPGNLVNRKYVDKIIEDLLLPESRILGLETLLELHRRSREGKSCLVLLEHYSNFDLPAFIYLLSLSGPEGQKAADSIIAIAGLKLNVESKAVLAFTEAYSRIVIYPSRYLEKITDPEALKQDRKKGNLINRAAMHEMVRCKHSGNMILVFPSGTRYRPGNPDTKRGLKEIDSYLKVFDYMVLVGIKGNILRIHPSGEMEEDQLCKDRVLYKVSPILECSAFRKEARAKTPKNTDQKQFVADEVMRELEKIHTELERTADSI